jgi:membrane-associated phospholipid phosphatase
VSHFVDVWRIYTLMMGRQIMLRHEWIAVLFFAHLAVAALVRRRMPARRRTAAGIGAVIAAAGVFAIAHIASMAVRAWAPILFILAGYYLSGRTFFAPNPRIESWLAAIDRRLLGDPPFFSTWPAPIVRVLDAAYIGCFLLVPAGLGLLFAAGHSDQAGRYWTLVVACELGAFAALPYLQTRPPWVLERIAEHRDGDRRRASVVFMQGATTGANTLPSGHAAGSLAVALAVLGTLPTSGLVLLMLAFAISVGAVVTRAHFVVDIIAGVVLASAVWWLM